MKNQYVKAIKVIKANKKKFIPIDISNFDSDAQICTYLSEIFKDELMEAIDFSFLEQDENSLVDNIAIEKIQPDKLGNFTIHYKITWSIFYGCQDMHFSDVKQGIITGIREKQFLRFEKPLKLEPRTTIDEF